MANLFSGYSMLMWLLGWSLLHSLWQGAIIFFCLWICLKILPQLNAKLKYALALLAMIVFVSWFGFTLKIQFNKLQTSQEMLLSNATNPFTVRHHTDFNHLNTSNISNGFSHDFMTSIQNYIPLLSWIYIIGVLLMSMRLILQLRGMYQLSHSGLFEPSDSLQQTWLRIKKQMEAPLKTTLHLSEKIVVPVAVGFLKPMVLLPATVIIQLDAEQIEAILLHELAHIRRNDFMVNLLQTVVETLFFFNPFLWRISGIIRREREHCCDDVVVAQTQSPLSYATALTVIAQHQANAYTLTLAASGQKPHLFNRIKRIMNMKKKPFNYGQLLAAIIVIAVLGLAVTYITPALAQQKQQKNVAQNNDTTHATTVIVKRIHKDADDDDSDISDTNNDANNNHLDDKQVEVLVQKSLDAVDWNAVQQGIKTATNALSYLDFDKLEKTLDATMATLPISNKEARKEIEAAKKEIRKAKYEARNEMENAKNEIENSKQEMENARIEMKNARTEMENDRQEMQQDSRDEDDGDDATTSITKNKNGYYVATKNSKGSKAITINKSGYYGAYKSNDGEPEDPKVDHLLSDMEVDGLINRSKSFAITINDKGVFINNNQPQPKAVFDKYRNYIKAKTIAVSGSKLSLAVSIVN